MPQRLKSLMSESQEMRGLLNTVQTLTVLQQHFAQVAPPYLAQATQVLGLRLGTLSLAAANGTIAAKLRQLVPDLVEKLQNRGCEVSGIRVKVQVSYAAYKPKPTPRRLSPTARRELKELGEHLTDSPLKLAVEKFSRD